MSKTKIEWADITINPIVGCSKISNGCKNCYAHKMFPRLKAMGIRLYKDMEDFSDVKWDLNILKKALKKLKNPKRIFLCSMSDLFHEKVPDYIIRGIRDICNQHRQHTFLILTKRYERLSTWFVWPTNIKFGVSVSNDEDLFNVFLSALGSERPFMKQQKVFVSFEPLLEKLDKKLLKEFITRDVNWIIVGAETGGSHREFKEEWALDILKVAREYDIPFFFKKQLKNGEWTNKLNGKEYLELPKGE